MNAYAKGATVRIRTATPFKDAGGVVTDPTAVTLRVQTPAGVETAYTYAAAQLSRVGPGDYYRDVTVSETGRWVYRWEGTGAVAAVDEDEFVVLTSEF